MKRIWISVLVLVNVSVLAFSLAAQTPKKSAKPLATPIPTLSGAEIISRANDYVEIQPVNKVQEKADDKSPATTAGLSELLERVRKLESSKNATYDEKQKRLLLNLDILTRAEQRSESLRKQLFEMIEKENAVKARVDQIDFESRSEIIERTLQLAGSMRPEEIRDNRRKSLLAEKANLQALLMEIQSTRANLNANLTKAEVMVEKLREKLEKDIDDSFLKADEPDFRDPE